jgi:hypothetical protein
MHGKTIKILLKPKIDFKGLFYLFIKIFSLLSDQLRGNLVFE